VNPFFHFQKTIIRMKKMFLFATVCCLILMASCGSPEYDSNPKNPSVGQRVDTTLQDIKTSSETAADNLRDAADTTKSDLKQAAQDVKNDMREAYHKTKKVARKGAEKVEEKTKEIDEDLKK
jgi:ABC-type transporter lipoprotein component MlaA